MASVLPLNSDTEWTWRSSISWHCAV